MDAYKEVIEVSRLIDKSDKDNSEKIFFSEPTNPSSDKYTLLLMDKFNAMLSDILSNHLSVVKKLVGDQSEEVAIPDFSIKNEDEFFKVLILENEGKALSDELKKVSGEGTFYKILNKNKKGNLIRVSGDKIVFIASDEIKRQITLMVED